MDGSIGGLVDSELADRAEKALGHDLCDHCLGRLFAQVDTGLSDRERGESLRMAVAFQRAIDGKEPLPPHVRCIVCEELFDMLPRFADAVVDKLQEVEHHNFLVGTRVDPLITEREERLWAEVGQEKAETIKAELNQEIGKLVEQRTGKKVDFKTPEVVALVDTRFAHVDLDISPLFVYARYRKLSREIPQTRWPCNRCRGKGCEKCHGTGKMYQTSVQEIIGDPILKAAESEDHFFHGMGREDIDARMLGDGRPFVLELRNPKKRDLDLDSLLSQINDAGKGMVEVVGPLRYSSREEVRFIKSASPEKEYRVSVKLQGKIDKGLLDEVISSLKRKRITQQTPTRVAHRRADLAREREVVDLTVEEFDGESLVLKVRTESGTYVKEFVHGDQGRTTPSLCERLGVPCEVKALDVIHIYDERDQNGKAVTRTEEAHETDTQQDP
ncbi:MAG TPA: tRNA pseudouridine(54/55) synthase Pus10 [Methanomassiliicoccales archaeon]|nr:tRNA pseudouridine(54/55) synthase Pus10 [Methanomassiliicoccales archaeon]